VDGHRADRQSAQRVEFGPFYLERREAEGTWILGHRDSKEVLLSGLSGKEAAALALQLSGQHRRQG
jgi:hypothetical protein